MSSQTFLPPVGSVRALCGEHGSPLSMVERIGHFGCEHGCDLWGADLSLEAGTHIEYDAGWSVWVVENPCRVCRTIPLADGGCACV